MSSAFYFGKKPIELHAHLADKQEKLLQLKGNKDLMESRLQSAFDNMGKIETPAQLAALVKANTLIVQEHDYAVNQYNAMAEQVQRMIEVMSTDKYKADLAEAIEIQNKEKALSAEGDMARLLWSTFPCDQPSSVIKQGVTVNFKGHPFGGRTYTNTDGHLAIVLMESTVKPDHWWVRFQEWLLCVPRGDLQ